MPDLEEQTVKLDWIDSMAVVTLNRPSALNAINVQLGKELKATLDDVASSPCCRLLLLRGAGRAFCAGGDLRDFEKEERLDLIAETIDSFHAAILALDALRVPTVAAVHGAVAGAGLSMMLACDLAVAAQGTRFTVAYPKIGASIDGGASWLLTRTLGLRKAKELAMLSEQWEAEQALELGLINRILEDHDFHSGAQNFARHLATGPTAAFARISNLFNTAFSRDLAGQLDAERVSFLDVASTSDFVEGVAAFLQKRLPSFAGK